MNMIEKKMTTKEVAEICGVTEKTVRENAKTFGKLYQRMVVFYNKALLFFVT